MYYARFRCMNSGTLRSGGGADFRKPGPVKLTLIFYILSSLWFSLLPEYEHSYGNTYPALTPPELNLLIYLNTGL